MKVEILLKKIIMNGVLIIGVRLIILPIIIVVKNLKFVIIDGNINIIIL